MIDKLHEEIDEVRVEFAALAAAPEMRRRTRSCEDEIGDLLFVCANLARHAKVDVGGALRRANAKFERRFRAMEALAARRRRRACRRCRWRRRIATGTAPKAPKRL